jgi:predicted RNase H-like HicB family nuclease
MLLVKLEDYTLNLRYREDWNCFEASLSEFFALIASGETEQEAITELKRLYLERVVYLEAIGKPLPIPGEAPEPMFATSARVDALSGTARDFFKRVLNLDYDDVFVSDATRLEEFGKLESLREKIKLEYGVDIGTELEQPLWEVLGKIRRLG